MSYFFNNDVFDIFGCRDNVLNLHLPLTPATYMISLQTSALMGIEMTISDRNGDKKIQNVIPLTSKDGFVALTQILPKIYEEGLGFCQFIVSFPFPSSTQSFWRLYHHPSVTFKIYERERDEKKIDLID